MVFHSNGKLTASALPRPDENSRLCSLGDTLGPPVAPVVTSFVGWRRKCYGANGAGPARTEQTQKSPSPAPVVLHAQVRRARPRWWMCRAAGVGAASGRRCAADEHDGNHVLALDLIRVVMNCPAREKSFLLRKFDLIFVWHRRGSPRLRRGRGRGLQIVNAWVRSSKLDSRWASFCLYFPR